MPQLARPCCYESHRLYMNLDERRVVKLGPGHLQTERQASTKVTKDHQNKGRQLRKAMG